jgi:threonine dehydratase
MAGQGTIGLEIAEECEHDATVVVPVGGGGLLAGIATALKSVRPAMKIVGVEAAGAAAVRASLDAGDVVTLDSIATIADGIAVKTIDAGTLEHIRARADDVVTVDDDRIATALLILLERAKAVVEPAGAVGLAALLAGAIDGDGPVLLVVSGGNVDPLLLTHLIEHGLTAAGRYLILRVVLADRPGELALLTQAVADLGLNVVEVEHHRVGLTLGVDRVEVLLTLETRDPEHRDAAVRALRDSGFAVETVAR